MGSCIMPSEKHSGTLCNLGVAEPNARAQTDSLIFRNAQSDTFPTRRSENGSHFLKKLDCPARRSENGSSVSTSNPWQKKG